MTEHGVQSVRTPPCSEGRCCINGPWRIRSAGGRVRRALPDLRQMKSDMYGIWWMTTSSRIWTASGEPSILSSLYSWFAVM